MRNKRNTFIAILAMSLLLTGCNNGDIPFDVEPGDDPVETPYEDLCIDVKEINFSNAEKNLSIIKGKTHTYEYTYAPSNATPATSVTWTSNDESVATVKDGVLTAVEGGKTSITVAPKHAGSFPTTNLLVEVIVPLESFSLSAEEITLDYNETYTLETSFVPENATNKNLTWSVKNANGGEEEIASVYNGVITANAITGDAIIEAKSDELNTSKQVIVHVIDKTIHVEKVTLDVPEEIEVDKTGVASISCEPNDAKAYLAGEVTYSTTTPSIISIDSKTGAITALESGVATVTATCEGKSDTKNINVYEVRATGLNIKNAGIVSNTLKLKDNAKVQLEYEYVGLAKYVGAEKVSDDVGEHVAPSRGAIAFASTNSSVLAISGTGMMEQKGAGSATVTVSDTKYNLSTSITVICSISVTGFELTPNEAEVMEGDSVTISPAITPINGSFDSITYVIDSGDDYISIAQNGNDCVVTGINEGEATVKAMLDVDGETKYATATITIIATKTLYLNANGVADVASAKLYAHVFETSGDHDGADVLMTLVDDQTIIYEATIPEYYDKVVFARNNPEAASFTWEEPIFWGKSDDLTIGSNNMWTVEGWKYNPDTTTTLGLLYGTWGTYSASTTYTAQPASYYVYSVYGLPDWVTNDGCVIFAWVWGASTEGKWVALTFISSTAVAFNSDVEYDGFLLARCAAGTTEPDWGKTSGVGTVYNKTGDITTTSGTFTYASPDWVQQN